MAEYIPHRYREAMKRREEKKVAERQCELPLEERSEQDLAKMKGLASLIMRDVGLGFPPEWYAGDCLIVRRSALQRLPDVILRYARDKRWRENIVAPVDELVAIVRRTVAFEERNTPMTLHRTWQTVYAVIVKHIELADARSAFFRDAKIEQAQEEAVRIMDRTDDRKGGRT